MLIFRNTSLVTGPTLAPLRPSATGTGLRSRKKKLASSTRNGSQIRYTIVYSRLNTQFNQHQQMYTVACFYTRATFLSLLLWNRPLKAIDLENKFWHCWVKWNLFESFKWVWRCHFSPRWPEYEVSISALEDGCQLAWHRGNDRAS